MLGVRPNDSHEEPSLGVSPSPGQVAAVQARASACRELVVLVEALEGNRTGFRVETGDRLSLQSAAEDCGSTTEADKRIAHGRVDGVLRHNPFASASPDGR